MATRWDPVVPLGAVLVVAGAVVCAPACGGSATNVASDDASVDATSVDGANDGDDGGIHYLDGGFNWDGHTRFDAPTACGPDNCSGCCDTGGRCVAGSDTAACGNGGNLCLDCAAQGAFCTAARFGGGVCTKSLACGPHNCVGCCVGDQCMPQSDANCGTNGETCTTCAPGEFCKGSCYTKQRGCNAANCAGCCNGDNCGPGTANNGCGRGGERCEQCQPSQGGGQCVLQPDGGGLCNGVQTCTPLNCGGCCNGNICHLGTEPDSCGPPGGVCRTCATGEACAMGVCGTNPCGDSCKGCCNGSTCVTRDTDTACGLESICIDCTAIGRVCVKGKCIDPYGCNAYTCAGCCIGALCAVGNQDIACAAAQTPGERCADCTVHGLHCSNGMCQ